MPNPMDEETEKEIHRLQILAIPFVDEIMPKLRLLSSQTKGMTPGQYIPLAIGVLVEQMGLSKEEEKQTIDMEKWRAFGEKLKRRSRENE